MFMDFFTATEDVELIELVRVNSVLFDCSHFMHTDSVHKNYIWKQTAAKIGRTPRDCKMRWNNIKYTYNLHLKGKSNLRSTAVPFNTKWNLLSRMSFLDFVNNKKKNIMTSFNKVPGCEVKIIEKKIKILNEYAIKEIEEKRVMGKIKKKKGRNGSEERHEEGADIGRKVGIVPLGDDDVFGEEETDGKSENGSNHESEDGRDGEPSDKNNSGSEDGSDDESGGEGGYDGEDDDEDNAEDDEEYDGEDTEECDDDDNEEEEGEVEYEGGDIVIDREEENTNIENVIKSPQPELESEPKPEQKPETLIAGKRPMFHEEILAKRPKYTTTVLESILEQNHNMLPPERMNEIINLHDSVDLFFDSIAANVKKFPNRVINEVKIKISTFMAQLEDDYAWCFQTLPTNYNFYGNYGCAQPAYASPVSNHVANQIYVHPNSVLMQHPVAKHKPYNDYYFNRPI